MEFVDRLRSRLTLTLGGKSVEFPGASVQDVSCRVRPFGFEARVTVAVSTEQEPDPLLDTFLKRDIMEAALELASGREMGDEDERESLTLKGVVVERAWSETVAEELDGQPITQRRYTVRFLDPAAALWREHHPLELHADASFKTVLEAHRPKGVVLEYDWSVLDEELPMICLAPGGADSDGASFYDLVAWYLERHGGLLEYDVETARYRLAPKKRIDIDPCALAREEVAQVEYLVPEAARHKVQVLNGTAQVTPETRTEDNGLSAAGVRRELLERSPLSTPSERRAKTEARRIKAPGEEVRFHLACFPYAAMRPGRFFTAGEGFSSRARASNRLYRVVEFTLEAKRPGGTSAGDEDLSLPVAEYEMRAAVLVEDVTSPSQRRPGFRKPAYPIFVEGKVVSAGGGDDDRTWLAVEDSATSLFHYKVDIPLWNKKILVPFEPDAMPGHLFFPAYKNARVLVRLDFGAAHITRFLDWAPGAQGPQDLQSNRMVLGRSAVDGTVIEHVYKDAMPVLRLARKFGKDLQTIEISDGLFKLEVKEDSAAPAVTPKYDVSIQVEESKGRLNMHVKGGIAAMTGDFEDAVAGPTAALDSATTELDGSLASMESSLGGKIDATKAEAQGAVDALASNVAEVEDAVTQAKAAIQTLLDD